MLIFGQVGTDSYDLVTSVKISRGLLSFLRLQKCPGPPRVHVYPAWYVTHLLAVSVTAPLRLMIEIVCSRLVMERVFLGTISWARWTERQVDGERSEVQVDVTSFASLHSCPAARLGTKEQLEALGHATPGSIDATQVVGDQLKPQIRFCLRVIYHCLGVLQRAIFEPSFP